MHCSLCHIENWAVDLSWDIIARFGQEPSYHLPRAFFDDFVRVAEDECRHFLLLEKRLEEMGSFYGALPAHDGLWESAMETAHSLAARLAVEHCTHEARGLDVLPQTIHRFRSNGDEASALLLEGVIYPEEISHCAAGVRWLRHLHSLAHSAAHSTLDDSVQRAQHEGGARQQRSDHAEPALHAQTLTTQQAQHSSSAACTAGDSQALGASREARCEGVACSCELGGAGSRWWGDEARSCPTVEEWFHLLIRAHFRGPLKPPFNEEARAKAGFGPEWYLPLAQPAPPPRQ